MIYINKHNASSWDKATDKHGNGADYRSIGSQVKSVSRAKTEVTDMRTPNMITLSALALGVATMAHAQQNRAAPQSVDIGQYYYDSHCAICHGLKGTGLDREPHWSLLNRDIPSLATLSQRNAGVFPFKRVYEIIDGREDFDRQIRMAHGSREMPIWGREFTAQSLSISPIYDPEAFARAKIVALTDYVYRLQAK